jgi:membrane protease YdiL (CAAX protease family)
MTRKLIEIAIIFSVFFLPGYVLGQAPGAVQSLQIQGMMLNYIIIALPHILLLLYILWIGQEPSLAEFGIRKPDRKLWYALPVYMGAFAVVTPLLFALSLLPEAVINQITTQPAWLLGNPAQLPLTGLFCLVVGYREELFFRAYLLTRFGEFRINRHLAALISSLIFAGAHLYENVFGMLTAFVIGLFFSYVFYEWKNLHIIALAHSAYNFTLFIVNFF